MPEPEENAEDSERYGFLTFAMVKSDRQHVYPGEIAPVRIKAYFPMGASVSLRSKPRPEGSAFTLHNLTEEPQQSTETVNGKPYRVVTWFGGLSATKAGEYPASMTLEATLQLRDRNASRQQRPAGFNDPFFDRAFGGGFFDDFFAPVVQKDITISSENPPTLEVKELPQEGRPANFTGAIGQFAFDGVAVPSSMQTGEPTQVRASISGKGNFALLKQPEPDSAKDWKSYSGQDTFTPGDAASFGGTKAFTFNLVPRTPGTEPLRLGFSFFDPDRGQYVEKKSDPIDVAVTGKALSTEVNEAATSPSAPQPDTPDLAPLRMELGPTSSYQPLTRAAWFVPTLIGCGALTILLLTLGLRARHRSDPDRVAQRAAQQAEARALAEAEAAVRQGDTGAFLQAARQALRVRLAAVDGVRAEAVTLNELEGRVDTKALELWRAADLMDYSGGTTVRGTLTEWSAALRSALDNLTSPPTAA